MKTEYFGNSEIVRQHLANFGAEIKPGDWYLAQRNGPPQVLKCNHVNDRGWIVPSAETPGYSFEIAECTAFKKSVPAETMQHIYVQSRDEVRAWVAQQRGGSTLHLVLDMILSKKNVTRVP